MGTFSKCCSKSNLPVLMESSWSHIAKRLTKVVVLLPQGDVRFADYDGYGLDLEDYHLAKFVLQAFYAGETYASLPASGDEPGQGSHHDPEFVTALETLLRFPSHAAYLAAYREYVKLIDERHVAGFEASGLAIPESVRYGVAQILEAALESHPLAVQRARTDHPDASEYVPMGEADLRVVATRFDVAARALATTHAQSLADRYGTKLV